MTEFEITLQDGNRIYIKEEMRKMFKGDKAIAIANAKTITLFPAEADLEDVEASLEIVLEDVRLRRRIEEKENDLTR